MYLPDFVLYSHTHMKNLHKNPWSYVVILGLFSIVCFAMALRGPSVEAAKEIDQESQAIMIEIEKATRTWKKSQATIDAETKTRDFAANIAHLKDVELCLKKGQRYERAQGTAALGQLVDDANCPLN